MSTNTAKITHINKFAQLCKSASNEWLINQLKASRMKWYSITYPEGFESLRDSDREAYYTNDGFIIDEIERRFNTLAKDSE